MRRAKDAIFFSIMVTFSPLLVPAVSGATGVHVAPKVSLVCHETFNSAWLKTNPLSEGKPLPGEVHFVEIDVTSKKAKFDNEHYILFILDKNFYEITADRGANPDTGQTIDIDRRDGHLSILAMSISAPPGAPVKVTPTIQAFGVCGTRSSKY